MIERGLSGTLSRPPRRVEALVQEGDLCRARDGEGKKDILYLSDVDISKYPVFFLNTTTIIIITALALTHLDGFLFNSF
jgi:hypothetical protein